jgi:hypothetical protein
VVELRVARLVEERPDPPRLDRWYSAKSAAARWDMHPLTIRRAHYAGRLPGYRILGCLRFREQDLLELLRQEGVPVEEEKP